MLKQWIVGITCAAMVGALADCLMPEGRVKRAGRLAVGLLLLLAAAQPLADWNGALWESALSGPGERTAAYSRELERENAELIKTIIEERAGAYISDKARELGIACTAQVVCRCGEDGQVWPESVVVRGSLTGGQRSELARMVEDALAIPAENQTFEGVMDQ